MKRAFCDCILEAASRQLWRDGKIVPLEPKMYELLEVLIQRSPNVVSNNELDELLWPKVYVARTSLTRLVSELRSLLGDSPREPRIIRTVYKTGYAFCATLNWSESTSRSAALVSLLWNDQRLPLPDGDHIAGRGVECSLLIDAVTVSRRHARFTVKSGTVVIEDLGSKNGVCVDGMRISQPTQLTDGAEVALGSAKLRVRAVDPAALTKADTSFSAGSAERR
jgi:DNA-binding winged helix-turn-helix (wHTH) protein